MVLLLPVYVLSNPIEPLTLSKDVNLPDALDVNVFNEPVLISIESTLFLVPRVVVATLELKLKILELNPDVVIATDELNAPILVEMEELNVE